MQTTVPQYDCNRTYANSDVTSGSKRRQDLHQLRGSGEGGRPGRRKLADFTEQDNLLLGCCCQHLVLAGAAPSADWIIYRFCLFSWHGKCFPSDSEVRPTNTNNYVSRFSRRLLLKWWWFLVFWYFRGTTTAIFRVTGSGWYETVTLKTEDIRSSDTSEQTFTIRCAPPPSQKPIIWLTDLSTISYTNTKHNFVVTDVTFIFMLVCSASHNLSELVK